jgi:uncharacterized membrane protein required for colicin V production
MNWLLIIVVALLIISALNGYRLGFIKKLFTTFSFIITIIAASAMAPHISEFLKENTSMYDSIKENTVELITNTDNEETKDSSNEVDEIKVPLVLKAILKESSTTQTITDSISDYIAKKLADTIINAISFALAFVVITIVLRTTIFTLDIIANLPIIKGINQYAGLLLGGFEGLLIVWFAFLIITIIGNTESGVFLTKSIEDSSFLQLIYNNNLFYKLF